ncbi:MAG: hypothetical protein WC934_06365 [Acidithiobacillus sp.]|jgi:hypothetical protein|uniref:hypothetical protein n=1 Tax=Acidithiobacillus sp. TaxID=1872118 RepID=UPI00355D22FA
MSKDEYEIHYIKMTVVGVFDKCSSNCVDLKEWEYHVSQVKKIHKELLDKNELQFPLFFKSIYLIPLRYDYIYEFNYDSFVANCGIKNIDIRYHSIIDVELIVNGDVSNGLLTIFDMLKERIQFPISNCFLNEEDINKTILINTKLFYKKLLDDENKKNSLSDSLTK